MAGIWIRGMFCDKVLDEILIVNVELHTIRMYIHYNELSTVTGSYRHQNWEAKGAMTPTEFYKCILTPHYFCILVAE